MAPTSSLTGEIILTLLTIATCVYFGFRVRYLVRLVRCGAPDNRSDDLVGRAADFVRYVFGQRRLVARPNRLAGAIHVALFWGFLIISLGTIQLFASVLFSGIQLPLTANNAPFSALIDLMSITVLVAVVGASLRRLILKPYRLITQRDAWIVLGLIASLMSSLLLMECFWIVSGHTTQMQWAFGGQALARQFAGIGRDTATTLFTLLLWWHLLTVLGFLAYLPSSKHLHILTAPFTIFFRQSAPVGALAPIDSLEERETFGAGSLQELSWKHLLDSFACTQCGRCDRNCPALLSDKPLSPRDLILNIKYALFAEADALLGDRGHIDEASIPLVGGKITDETLWSCTTCGWCVQACPVFIEHVPKIVEMRRYLVLDQARFPAEVQTVFTNLEKNGNPWPDARKQRDAWARELGVRHMADVVASGDTIEILFFVGCMGSYDQRNKKVATAVVELLKLAGVSFAILGKEEVCTGDPARRIGNEYLFKNLAEQNIATLNSYGISKVLTMCAHCFNSIRNEYPQFGGTYKVVHHTELIAELLESGRLSPLRPLEKILTFHDPCYLGRYNEVYEPQRRALKSLPMATMVEMERSRSASFCCGGGGGRSFMEENTGRRINQMRIEQAQEVEPDILVAACPFCTTMFEDGLKAKGVRDHLQVLDFAEVVLTSVANPARPLPSANVLEQ